MKKEKYDLIHAHLFYALVIATIAKFRYHSIQICFTSHSTNLGSSGLSSLLRDIVVFVLRPMRGIDIIFSKSQMRYIYKKNAIIIQNGIDTKKYNLNLQKNKIFTFISIARLESVKNHFGLIEIVKRINTSIPFQVLFVGDGSLREQIIEKIEQNNLSDKIKVLGSRNDIAELCSVSHVFVLNSFYEGMPIAILEAGACGLPVICTPVGSIPALINESNGFLATEARFIETMIYVMGNYDEAKKKGSTLQKQVIGKFDICIMYEKHIEVYLSLLKIKKKININ